EALELIQCLIRVRALPERIEQHRQDSLERAVCRLRIGDQRATFQNEPEVLAGAVGIPETGRLQRGVTRYTERGAKARGRRRRKELAKGLVYAARHAAMRREESLTGRGGRRSHAHSSAQQAELDRILRQHVDLELVKDLQPMLDRAQVHERVAQKAAERRREVASLGEAKDRAQRVALPEPWIVTAIEQLERLDEELDLADPSDAQLDVPALTVFGLDGVIDGLLHVADLTQDSRVEPPPPHE